MVAQFRLDEPNMSFVNVTPTNSTTDEEGQKVPAQPGELLATNQTLLTDLMGVDPNMRHVIMGGRSQEEPDRHFGNGGSSSSADVTDSPMATAGPSMYGDYDPHGDGTSGVPRRHRSINTKRHPQAPPYMGHPPHHVQHQLGGAVAIIKKVETVEYTYSVPVEHLPNIDKLRPAAGGAQLPRGKSFLGQRPPQRHGHMQGRPGPDMGGDPSQYNDVVRNLVISEQNLRRENECLRRENANQKRKLLDLARTFLNPEKAQEVLVLLEQKKRERNNRI